MKNVLIFTFFAFFCITNISAKRKCYQCTGKNECKNPTELVCESRVNGCIAAATVVEPYILRSCADNGAGGDLGLNGCIDTIFNGQKTRICECTDKDMCNDKDIDPPKNVQTNHFERRQMAKAKDVWMNLVKKH